MFQNNLTQDLRQYYHFLSEEVNREELNKVVNGLLKSCEEFDLFPLSLEGIDSVITDENCYYLVEIKNIDLQNIKDENQLESLLFDLYSCVHDCKKEPGEICLKVFDVVKDTLLSKMLIHILKKDKEEQEVIPADKMLKYETGISLGASVAELKTEYYTVYYGTNRKPKNPTNHSVGYGNEKSSTLHLGTCDVYIPDSHKFGEINGTIYSKVTHFDFSYGKIRLKQIKNYGDSGFWNELKELFNEEEGEALVFVHGYNNSFEDAAIRAAQMGYDLKIKGLTAFFSWPSKAMFSGYSDDEDTIVESEKYLKEFLLGFAEKSGAKKVNIIAHSMGNRALLQVIDDIQNKCKDIKFGQIILAAPDVDTELFKSIATAYSKLSERTTLYVSPTDRAVWFSKLLHGEARVGLAPPVAVVDGIDTIKVNLNLEILSMRHTYIAESSHLLHDINNLLQSNDNPKNRLNISSSSDYWELG